MNQETDPCKTLHWWACFSCQALTSQKLAEVTAWPYSRTRTLTLSLLVFFESPLKRIPVQLFLLWEAYVAVDSPQNFAQLPRSGISFEVLHLNHGNWKHWNMLHWLIRANKKSISLTSLKPLKVPHLKIGFPSSSQVKDEIEARKAQER